MIIFLSVLAIFCACIIALYFWLQGPAYIIRRGGYYDLQTGKFVVKTFEQQLADKCEFVHANGEPVLDFYGKRLDGLEGKIR